MGEGLKPLTTNQTPSENSHSAIASAAIAVSPDTCGQRPNSTPTRGLGSALSLGARPEGLHRTSAPRLDHRDLYDDPAGRDPVPEEESGAARKKASTMKGMIISHVEDPTGRAAVRDPGNQSIAELIKQVSEESSRLLRSELT